MIDTLTLNVLLAFLVGSIWISIATIAAERFGSKAGGLLAGLPSTIVVSLFFIGLNQTPQAAASAASVIPLVEGIDGLFLVAYAALAKRGFAVAFTLSFAMWAVLASIVALFKLQDIVISFLLYLPILLFSFYVLEIRMKLKSVGKTNRKYTAKALFGRAVLSGSVVAFAVLMSKFGGPTLGGIFAAFPAVFVSTVVITYISSGVEFSRAITKPLLMSGLITVIVYAIVANQAFPIIGIWYGTLVSYLASIPFAYATYLFIQKKLR